jgi:hypothetical protein
MFRINFVDIILCKNKITNGDIEIMFHTIDTTIVNSYIMYKVHITQSSKLVETMSHLKFNMVLARILIEKGACSTPKHNNNGRGFYTQS